MMIITIWTKIKEETNVKFILEKNKETYVNQFYEKQF